MKSSIKITICIVSLLSASVVLIHRNPVSSHYTFSFLYLLIPLLLVINLGALLFLLKQREWLALMPLAILLLSWQQIKETCSFHFGSSPSAASLRVVSYNVSTFNYRRFNNVLDTVTSGRSINWLSSEVDCDVLCMQEFYNNDGIEAESSLDRMDSAGFPYYYTNPIKIAEHNGYFGLITFSKYPIVKAGPLLFGDHGINRGVYTDLKVGDDTIRVLNVHLRSMSIRIDSSTTLLKPLTVVNNAEKIVDKLKTGFINRNKEVEVIGRFIDNSPHKVILCGDLNETPYSYVYTYLRGKLNNAFEEAGAGFGFTYNKFPYFIRIDNQFFDPDLRAVYFKVHSNNHYSDHLPIETHYVIN